jgi:hypothetical protein
MEYALLDESGVVLQVIVADAAFIERHPLKDNFVLTPFDEKTGEGKVGIGHELGAYDPGDRHVAAVFEMPGARAKRENEAASKVAIPSEGENK